MKAVKLDLALSYSPPGADVSLTLATVHDEGLLVAALKLAISDAATAERGTVNPFSVRTLRVQREYLQACLAEITSAKQTLAQ